MTIDPVGDFVGNFVGGVIVGLAEIGDWLVLLIGAFVGESSDSHVGNIVTLSFEVVLPRDVEYTTAPCESIKERVA